MLSDSWSFSLEDGDGEMGSFSYELGYTIGTIIGIFLMVYPFVCLYKLFGKK